jgi:hypothetical protein
MDGCGKSIAINSCIYILQLSIMDVQNDFSAYYSSSQSGRFNVARSYQIPMSSV